MDFYCDGSAFVFNAIQIQHNGSALELLKHKSDHVAPLL